MGLYMNSRQARLSSLEPQVRKHRPDYGLVVIACILLAVGLVVMYSISPALASSKVSGNYYVFKQFIAILLGLAALVITARIPLSFWERWQKPLIVATFITSLGTIASGGLSSRWIQLGLFSFEPVELIKFIMIVVGAGFLARAIKTGGLSQLKNLKPLLISLVAFALVIVALQRDLGSFFVLLVIALIMIFVAGLPLKRLLIFGGIGLAIVVIAISSTAYRRERLLTFLQPQRDCAGSGYQACQSLIAVGSGGVLGVGLGQGVQAYGYLPESANDSIFAIYAEKFGFVGVIVLIGLIGALLMRILNIMQRAPNRMTQIMCSGVFAWLGVQSLINIGAMIGLLPLKGITLPFISSGGTSLIFVMAALGIVFQISGYTSMRRSAIDFDNERRNDENNDYRRRNGRPRYTITRNSLRD
jgi:cell division protein FtsW